MEEEEVYILEVDKWTTATEVEMEEGHTRDQVSRHSHNPLSLDVSYIHVDTHIILRRANKISQ